MSVINKIVEDKIIKASIADIDIEAMAKKLKPLIHKELEKQMLTTIKNFNFEDTMCDALCEISGKLVSEFIKTKFTKGKK